MVIVENHHSGAQCVFHSCGHAPATHVLIHEFANYPDKPVCQHHHDRYVSLYPIALTRKVVRV